jgi:hypothetical protein
MGKKEDIYPCPFVGLFLLDFGPLLIPCPFVGLIQHDHRFIFLVIFFLQSGETGRKQVAKGENGKTATHPLTGKKNRVLTKIKTLGCQIDSPKKNWSPNKKK